MLPEPSSAHTGLRAEIITTGTEILLGEIVDTNAAWIAQQLRAAGVNLYYKTTVGDNQERVRAVIELGLTRSDVLIVSGGLGPTADDITRDAIAAATGCALELRPAALDAIQARFARFGVPMTDNNRQQALIPRGAAIIPNPVGTAPGFIVETAQGTVIALPGVPREMQRLMTDTVLPYLRERSGHQGAIVRRVLRTVGVGESALDSQLRDFMAQANPTVGLAAHTAQVDIRMTARAASPATAEALLDPVEAAIRTRVGRHIYTTVPEQTFEEVVAARLHAAGATLALVETNTGGHLTRRLQAAQPGPVLTASWTAGDQDLPPALRALLAPYITSGPHAPAAVAASSTPAGPAVQAEPATTSEAATTAETAAQAANSTSARAETSAQAETSATTEPSTTGEPATTTGPTATAETAATAEAFATAEALAQDAARRCAHWARQTAGATYGLALLGTGDPEHGVYGTAHGYTWIALSHPAGLATSHSSFGGADEYTVVRLGNQALGLLWTHLPPSP